MLGVGECLPVKATGVRLLLVLGIVSLSACQLPPPSSDSVQPVETGEPAASCDCPAVDSAQLQCPEPPPPQPAPAAPQPCTAPPIVQPMSAAKAGQGLLVLGRVEYVLVRREGSANPPMKLKARIDTGAGITSLHAHELVEFERDGEPWVRFGLLKPGTDKPVFFERPIREYANIKQQDNTTERRPVVRMSLTIGDLEESVEVTLTDRSDYVYQVLVGRNLLRDRAIVDVRRKFIADDGHYYY